MKYIDTHAHLNLKAFTNDLEEVFKQCLDKEVGVINVGTKLSTSARAVDLASNSKNTWATVGLHPIQTTPGYHDEDEIGQGGNPFTSQGETFDTEVFRKLASHEKVVGIGECGFDYYHTDKASYESQEREFIAQIELANELGLPLMIHIRNAKTPEESPTGRSAYADVYEVLKQYAKVPANLHFFAGTWEEARRFFDLGCTISFTGVITFAKDYEEVVKKAPLPHIHAETDCPFVAPVPYRGKRAEPWMVIEVVKKIAELKGLDEDVVEKQLLGNFSEFYKIEI